MLSETANEERMSRDDNSIIISHSQGTVSFYYRQNRTVQLQFGLMKSFQASVITFYSGLKRSIMLDYLWEMADLRSEPVVAYQQRNALMVERWDGNHYAIIFRNNVAKGCQWIKKVTEYIVQSIAIGKSYKTGKQNLLCHVVICCKFPFPIMIHGFCWFSSMVNFYSDFDNDHIDYSSWKCWRCWFRPMIDDDW